MGQPALKPRLTAAEFLAWDAAQAQRHEFLQGEVFAMAGAHEAHAMVAGNLYVALRQHLSGTPCRTFMSDMKLRVEPADAFFYPDLLVTCSEADRADPLIKREPVLLAEVPSPSTAAYDLGAKFAVYRQLASLKEYLVVDVEARRADLYRRGDQGLWVLHPHEGQDTVQLASVGARITPAQLWAELPAPAAPGAAAASVTP